jgi:hypothetical protein
LTGIDNSEGLGIDERIGLIRMDLREIGWEVVERIRLAHDKELWRVLVNMVMNLWVS